jgi:hypothetical protein
MSTPLRFLMVLLSAISITHAEVNQKTEPSKKEAVKAETPPPVAVSTLSIDDLSGFESYPKQVQSLVQSALALTRLELSYTCMVRMSRTREAWIALARCIMCCNSKA